VLCIPLSYIYFDTHDCYWFAWPPYDQILGPRGRLEDKAVGLSGLEIYFMARYQGIRSKKEMVARVAHQHYYRNDFARHCPNINADGHKMQPSPKIPKDFRRQSFNYGGGHNCLSRKMDLWWRTFYLCRQSHIAHLLGSIYGVLKSIFGRGPPPEKGPKLTS
jgi:hypothetical protein